MRGLHTGLGRRANFQGNERWWNDGDLACQSLFPEQLAAFGTLVDQAFAPMALLAGTSGALVANAPPSLVSLED